MKSEIVVIRFSREMTTIFRSTSHQSVAMMVGPI